MLLAQLPAGWQPLSLSPVVSGHKWARRRTDGSYLDDVDSFHCQVAQQQPQDKAKQGIILHTATTTMADGTRLVTSRGPLSFDPVGRLHGRAHGGMGRLVRSTNGLL